MQWFEANTGSGLFYPEHLPPEQDRSVKLDTTTMACDVFFENVGALPNEEFARIRKDGFGGSDASVLLGVNPFTPLQELIRNKATMAISEEEKEIGNQIAVIKGNDLEPLIIKKFEKLTGMRTYKPTDMYVFRDFPYLKMNFDGVTGTPKQYIPVEIKVVTKRGEKHYNPQPCFYTSMRGWTFYPDNYAETNNSILTKAQLYGIPPYYYTQLQQEMMALNAPYSYLCTLWESTWSIHAYFIHRDPHVQNLIITEGFKAWEKVEALRAKGKANERVKILGTDMPAFQEAEDERDPQVQYDFGRKLSSNNRTD